MNVVDMKDINKLNKRDIENEIINEFNISWMLISKTLFERYTKKDPYTGRYYITSIRQEKL